MLPRQKIAKLACGSWIGSKLEIPKCHCCKASSKRAIQNTGSALNILLKHKNPSAVLDKLFAYIAASEALRPRRQDSSRERHHHMQCSQPATSKTIMYTHQSTCSSSMHIRFSWPQTEQTYRTRPCSSSVANPTPKP